MFFYFARAERFELPTAGFGDQCSTAELRPSLYFLLIKGIPIKSGHPVCLIVLNETLFSLKSQ